MNYAINMLTGQLCRRVPLASTGYQYQSNLAEQRAIVEYVGPMIAALATQPEPEELLFTPNR